VWNIFESDRKKNHITEKNVNYSYKIDIQKLQRQIVSASAKRKATDDKYLSIHERPAKILHRIATVQDKSLIKVSD